MRGIDRRWLILGGLLIAAVLLNSRTISMGMIGLLAIRFVLLFPAIILHEVAHGYMAYLLGDPTAKRMGRLTLNPIKHVDPVGTILLPLALLFISNGNFFFGYAKPVPFNPRNFKDERTGMLLTGIAGPVTNILLAVVFGLAVRFFPVVNTPLMDTFIMGVYYFAYFNLVLAFFNLVPVPPLDGSRVLQWFLPDGVRDAYHSFERYGFLALIALSWAIPGLFSGYLSVTVEPLFRLITGVS